MYGDAGCGLLPFGERSGRISGRYGLEAFPIAKLPHRTGARCRGSARPGISGQSDQLQVRLHRRIGRVDRQSVRGRAGYRAKKTRRGSHVVPGRFPEDQQRQRPTAPIASSRTRRTGDAKSEQAAVDQLHGHGYGQRPGAALVR